MRIYIYVCIYLYAQALGVSNRPGRGARGAEDQRLRGGAGGHSAGAPRLRRAAQAATKERAGRAGGFPSSGYVIIYMYMRIHYI